MTSTFGCVPTPATTRSHSTDRRDERGSEPAPGSVREHDRAIPAVDAVHGGPEQEVHVVLPPPLGWPRGELVPRLLTSEVALGKPRPFVREIALVPDEDQASVEPSRSERGRGRRRGQRRADDDERPTRHGWSSDLDLD